MTATVLLSGKVGLRQGGKCRSIKPAAGVQRGARAVGRSAGRRFVPESQSSSTYPCHLARFAADTTVSASEASIGVEVARHPSIRHPTVAQGSKPRLSVACAASAAESSSSSAGIPDSVVTGGFISLWYFLNIGFNLTNKSIFGFFPYPWTVSSVHVVIGSIYCALTYFLGFKKASFGRPISKEEFKTIAFPASMHGLGHIAANISFAAVAISLTHTVKTLEPVFNVAMSKIALGSSTSLPVTMSLLPIMMGVAAASAAEVSFNWTGFISAMLSNLTFSFRAVYSKKAMQTIKNLDSTAIYAYTTLISMLICVPLALIFEGPTLIAGSQAAIAKVGAYKFYSSLVSVGLLYHLYNQFAFNTLQRVNPVSHGVCNVVKRIAIIGSSVVFFGNTLTLQTKMGTAVALAGTALYTELVSREKHKK